MSFWQSTALEIKSHFFQYISESHGFLLNSIFQSLFFMMATIQLITWILKSLNFFFAKNFAKSNSIAKLLIFCLFFYIKIWTAHSTHLQILGYFCSVSICIHLYEGCVRLGTHFCLRYSKNRFGNISSGLSIILIYLSYKVFTFSQIEDQKANYPYVSLYFFGFGIILLITLIKGKRFIYVLIIMVMAASIIVLRSWAIEGLKNTLLCKVCLPFQCVIYLPFALQESYNSKREENQIKIRNNRNAQENVNINPSELLWAQVYFYIFFLINKRMYHIEIVFTSICILSYLCIKTSH